MLSIGRLPFLFTVIIATLIPVSSWSKDGVTPYTADSACQAQPPNDFFCVTDPVTTPDQKSVDILNLILFCQGPQAATFALVNTGGAQSFSYEYPMTAAPGFPSGFNSVSNNPTLIHLGPSSTYTVEFVFAGPVTSPGNCRFTASGEQFPPQH